MTISLGDWVRKSRRNDPNLPADAEPTPLPAHVGVWLDRCLWEPRGADAEGKPGRRALYEAAIKALAGNGAALVAYRPIFNRWKATLEAEEPGVARRLVPVTAASRVLLHPGTGSTVTEGALLIHHSYGVPYLSGSALKGICRAYAEAQLRSAGEEPDTSAWLRWLFGWQTGGDDSGEGAAGAIDLWDALLVPGDAPVLALDIVNPHHGDYYSSQGEKAAAPTDEPKPTHHLTVRPGTCFLVALELRGVADAENPPGPWLDFVEQQILRPALSQLGIGARTAAGYGRFDLPASGEARSSQGSMQAEARVVTVMVTWDPGGAGRLEAPVPGGKARAEGADAQLALKTLPEETLQRLKKKKALSLKVHYSALGNALKITGLEPA